MKRRLLIPAAIILLTASCASNRNASRDDAPGLSGIRDFFLLCESDIHAAAGVIRERGIIGNLTHLQRMNEGGRKYYLLERESISAMVKAVTEGLYSDFILVNAEGTVVYTRTDDYLFGKNVRSAPAGNPLAGCFARGAAGGLYIEDASLCPPGNAAACLFIALPVTEGGRLLGVFILQVGVDRLVSVLGKGTRVVGPEGGYLIAGPGEPACSPCPFFGEMNAASPTRRVLRDGWGLPCFSFRFKNLSWFIVTGSPDGPGR